MSVKFNPSLTYRISLASDQQSSEDNNKVGRCLDAFRIVGKHRDNRHNESSYVCIQDPRGFSHSWDVNGVWKFIPRGEGYDILFGKDYRTYNTVNDQTGWYLQVREEESDVSSRPNDIRNDQSFYVNIAKSKPERAFWRVERESTSLNQIFKIYWVALNEANANSQFLLSGRNDEIKDHRDRNSSYACVQKYEDDQVQVNTLWKIEPQEENPIVEILSRQVHTLQNQLQTLLKITEVEPESQTAGTHT